MTTLSLREAWSKRYSNLDLHTGIHANIHPFYTAVSDTLPASTLLQRQRAFPGQSLRSLIEGLEWPKGFVPTAATPHDHPKEQAPGWTDKLQGVTHDDWYWYFAQEDKLWKIPVTHDLNLHYTEADLPFTTRRIDDEDLPLAGYDHFGDIDFFNGLLYVALEGKDAGLPSAVAIFDQNLQFRGKSLLSQGTSGPWCAVNPLNSLLYSADFNDNSSRIRLQIYERIIITNTSHGVGGLELKHLGTMELFDEAGQPFHLGGLQGAAFSRRGHLYLVVDTVADSADEPTHRGIMAFDMLTGRRMIHTLVDYRPWKHYLWGWEKIQELEGITIWEDADMAGAPGISGQLHLVMLDKELLKDDDLYFKHYEVAFAEDRRKV